MENLQEKSFEELLNRVQEISNLLDGDVVDLEESLKLYEEGILLTKECYTRLNKAELKITELKNDLERSIKIEVQQD